MSNLSLLHRWVPEVIKSPLRRIVHRAQSTTNYEKLYESWAKKLPVETSIGAGNYEMIGRVELAVLREAGLQPADTLVDFGCGTGRLSLHVIPTLLGGHYVGIDISKTMIRHARAAVERQIPAPPCKVDFRVQTTPSFDLPDRCADMLCAFSVFTHMEHEDNYRYLKAMRRIIKDDGRVVFSCLPMELADARRIFLEQASKDAVERWANVRNVTTSRDFMDELTRMAGWEPVTWFRGDVTNFHDPVTNEKRAMGQSVCVLRPA